MENTRKQSMEKKTARLVLLDAHAILHRAYHALPDFSAGGEPTGALYGLSAMLLKIIGELRPDYIAAAYDLPKATYRHEAYKEYKAGRATADEDLVAQIVRSRDVLAAFGIPIYEKEGFEADDVLGTIVEELKNRKDIEVIIASGDMDTLQLVDDKRVQVYTLRKGMQDTILYDEKAVRERFGFGPDVLPDYKGLRGDPSDNIPGVKGIGEKTATTLITQFGTIEKLYAALKKSMEKVKAAGVSDRVITLLTEGKEEAEFSKMLATIRRDAPIAFSLPETSWREALDLEKIRAKFSELGFRSLTERLKNYFGDKADAPVSAPDPATSLFSSSSTAPEPLEREVREAGIALWLLSSDITNPARADVENYSPQRDFYDGAKRIFSELKKQGLEKIFDEIERPLMPVLDAMKERGVLIDVAYLKELSREYHGVLSQLEKRIWKRAGTEFNINSPRQLADVLYGHLGIKGSKKTPTGQRSTRESELIKLQEKHPVAAEILKHRELQKLLSTYIDAFPAMADARGRLHPTFVQTGAATGRLSSQGPNVQNIPIRTELGRSVRGAFISEKWYSLLELDYSQIELRLAAMMSDDEKLQEAFTEGKDIHAAVAAEMFGLEPENVTPTERRTAKVINFGILYGMGANALAQTAGINREEAHEYLSQYAATFATLMEFLEGVKEDARRKGYTETMFGRRRFFPALSSKLPHLRAEAERQAINAPIQGTEADIIKFAMVRADEWLKKDKIHDDVRLVLQIHDSLVYEVSDGLVEKAAAKLREIMEGILSPEQTRGVPVVVDASFGKRWSELKKIR